MLRVVNRGVAVYQGKVYVGSLDGRLIALEAKTGRLIWEVNTIDRTRDYTITGAPRGLVFIGNGGAEYGVRGYATAYDAETGEQVWRFYAVPGHPLPRRRRQSVPVLYRSRGRLDGPLQMALPDHPGGQLGLYRHAGYRHSKVLLQAPKNGFRRRVDALDRKVEIEQWVARDLCIAVFNIQADSTGFNC